MAALLCGAPCRALGPVCGACDDCCCPEGRPRPLFLGYTAVLNGVGGALGLGFGIKALVEGPCREGGELPAFLLVGLGTNVFFILFAVHLYRQFSKPYNPLDFTGTGEVARRPCRRTGEGRGLTDAAPHPRPHVQTTARTRVRRTSACTIP